ncbi:MAG: hypothetical protein K0Q87_1428 [Neobacillus sp.]|jgi:hypothetical protein|nr:hypothetical protein [Neobacillus sp.]
MNRDIIIEDDLFNTSKKGMETQIDIVFIICYNIRV